MTEQSAYVQIGVAGHRRLAHTDGLADTVRRAVRRISEILNGKEPWFLTSLAEGADQLVIDAMGAGAHYTAVLPLPADEFACTFSAEDARQRLGTLLAGAARVITLERENERNAFEHAGNYILENTDVALVLWDGQAARGRGGTGDFVEGVRRAEKPLVWIHTAPTDHDDVCVTWERL